MEYKLDWYLTNTSMPTQQDSMRYQGKRRFPIVLRYHNSK